MNRRLAVLVLAVCIGLVGCSSRPAAPQVHQVEIRAMQFVPAELEVAVGDTIVWTNHDVVPHTVTAADPVTAAGGFDSGALTSQQQWQHTVVAPGPVAYVCSYHPTMQARLRVR